MMAPAVLLVYAVLMAAVVPRMLRDARWAQRSPRIGIVVWQALTMSVVLSAFLAGGALAVPTLPVSTDVAELLHACAMAIQQQYATPAGAALSTAGALFALAIIGRAGYCLAAAWLTARRNRSRQRQALALVAHRHDSTGALLVDHASRAAYCLPGRRREVVLTSAALAALDEQQLCAVLEHERAHLRHRHDLVLLLAGALTRAFPRVAAFSIALAELARLVEMEADDLAARQQPRLTLATALVRLADATTPVGALGAGGESALARVRRLLAPAQPLALGWSVLAGTAALLALLVPLSAVIAPALAATAMNYCPLQFPT